MDWNVHRKAGREGSACFCFTSLQKQPWNDIKRVHFVRFFLLFPFSQHPSVPPHLVSLPCVAGSLAELLMGGMPSGHRDQLSKVSPDIMTLFKATKQSRATHFFGGCRSVIQRFLAPVAPSQASGIALCLCWHCGWLTIA